jgi:hypothetical protein
MARLTREQIIAWTERTCAEQQRPVAVSDPITLARVGVLLAGTGDAATYSRQTGRTRSRSKVLPPR